MMNGILFAAILAAQSIAGAPSGGVSGRILFANGTPGAGIRVRAWTLPVTPDADFSSQVVIAQTDAQGHYQPENVPPGRYYIGAGRLGDRDHGGRRI